MSKVFWKPHEVELVVKKAAELMLVNDCKTYSWPLCRAQDLVLPENRRRSANSLGCKVSDFREAVDAHVEVLRKAQALVGTNSQKEPSTTVAPYKAPEVPAPVMKPVSAIVDSFDTKIILGPNAAKLLDEMAKDAAQKILKDRYETLVQNHLAAMGENASSLFPVVGMRSGEKALPIVEIKASNSLPAGSTEVTAILEKVGFIDNNKRGSKDFEILKKNVEDKYKFIHVHSTGRVGALMDCDIVVVSKHCSPDVYRAAQKMIIHNALWIENQTANSANKVLCERMNLEAPGF